MADGFEKRERLGPLYWKDPLWKEVTQLRREHKTLEANSLVMKLRRKYGLE